MNAAAASPLRSIGSNQVVSVVSWVRAVAMISPSSLVTFWVL